MVSFNWHDCHRRKTERSIVSKAGLDGGEAESLALASSRKLMVILDDRRPAALGMIGLE